MAGTAPSPSVALTPSSTGAVPLPYRGNSPAGGSPNRTGQEAAWLGQLRESVAQRRTQTEIRPARGGLEMTGGEFFDEFEQEGGPVMDARGLDQARQQSFRSQLQAGMSQAKDQLMESEAGKEAIDQIRKEFRKTAKAAIRRGVEYLIDFLAGCIDVGTVGVSVIVDIFIYAFTLVDLNIQMIWGYYITKKKSILFPALEWSPIKVPLPDIWLHLALVVFDLLILAVILIVFGFALLVLLAPFLGPAFALALGYQLVFDASFRTSIIDMAAIAAGAK